MELLTFGCSGNGHFEMDRDVTSGASKSGVARVQHPISMHSQSHTLHQIVIFRRCSIAIGGTRLAPLAIAAAVLQYIWIIVVSEQQNGGGVASVRSISL